MLPLCSATRSAWQTPQSTGEEMLAHGRDSIELTSVWHCAHAVPEWAVEL
jgi:hypothetical protein